MRSARRREALRASARCGYFRELHTLQNSRSSFCLFLFACCSLALADFAALRAHGSVSVSGRRGAARLLRLLAAGVSGNRFCRLRSCLCSSAASRQSDDNISVRPPSNAAKTIMGGAFSRAGRGQRHDARSMAQSGGGRARSSESSAPAPAAKGKSAPKIQIQYIIQCKYV
jgi:hypothetical protein